MRQKRTLRIGARVRAARRRAGMTLDALSKTSGVSKAMLSHIEQNKANPTVVVLHSVATALNVRVSELMGETAPETRFHAIRADDERYQFIDNQEYAIRTLSPLRLEKDIEFYEVRLRGRASLESAPHYTDTEEFVTVARGRVRVCAGKREAVLKKGDSAHYAADAPHCIENLNRSEAVVYMVVKYRAAP